MSTGKGYKAYPVAIAQGADWGTAVVATTDAGFPILNERISGPDVEEDESLTGNVWGNEPSLGNESHGGDLDAWFRYGANSDLVCALSMGIATTPSALANGYKHTIQLADAPSVFFTLAIDKDTDVWEYDSCIVNNLTIRGSAGGRISIVPEIRARKLARNAGAGTNNNTTKLNITTPYASTRGIDIVYFSQCRFRINTDAGALDAADEVFPANFEIVLNNNQSEDFLADDANPKLLVTPTRAGRPSVSGFFEFPERTSQVFDDIYYSQTPFKFDMLFTSTILIGGAQYYQMKFDFPYCRMTNPDNANVGGSDRIGNKVEFKALSAPSGAPTGMTTEKAFELYWYNNTATALLA